MQNPLPIPEQTTAGDQPVGLTAGGAAALGRRLAALPRAALALAAVALLGLVVGLAVNLLGDSRLASWTWTLFSLPVLAALLMQIARAIPRGEIGLDVLAAISMATAIVLGEPLAANVVALMYAGGQLLERYAEGHARREMTALLGRVATTAMRYDGSRLVETPITSLRPGDRLLIRQGEVIPVDGTVAAGSTSIDESALTGESLPVARTAGEEVLSGATLVGPTFDLDVKREAAASTYAGIVRLVEKAQQSQAPMARLADRYALWFLGLSLAMAGLAWYASGDPQRLLAVLVIATPCPLILAVPVALVSGMSKAARAGVLFKDGGAMEQMARVTTAILDKTGTLTHGEAAVQEIHALAGIEPDRLLQLAASLDQASGHVVARALITEAQRRGLVLVPPTRVIEDAGTGIEGDAGKTRVAVGSISYVRSRCGPGHAGLPPAAAMTGRLTVAVGIDGVFSGIIVLADPVRHDAAATLNEMRAAGLRRIVLASGDKHDVAEAIGRELGVDEILAELSPAGKVDAIANERHRGIVMMVGDGVNDAPALAAADIGVSMGARGAAASSEAAAVVVLVDRLEPLSRAIRIANRTRRIAIESVVIGLGLSIAGMIAAAFGAIEPVPGALLQEVIDVAVILNALRALR